MSLIQLVWVNVHTNSCISDSSYSWRIVYCLSSTAHLQFANHALFEIFIRASALEQSLRERLAIKFLEEIFVGEICEESYDFLQCVLYQEIEGTNWISVKALWYDSYTAWHHCKTHGVDMQQRDLIGTLNVLQKINRSRNLHTVTFYDLFDSALFGICAAV